MSGDCILRILTARAVGRAILELKFNDGTEKRVDLAPLLTGRVFAPLRDHEYFARVVVDPACGTVVWPNGADLAPEALRDLPSVESTRPRRRTG